MSTNGSQAPDTESPENLLNDRINLMAATTVPGITYGIMLSLYATCAYFLVQNLQRCRFSSRSEWYKNLFWLAYTTTLCILATIYTASEAQNAVLAYVDNRLFPEGPYEYYVQYMWNQPVMVMSEISYFLILWLTDALILWRFIMFYRPLRYARWVIPLPCAMYLSVIVLNCLVLQQEAGLGQSFYVSVNLPVAYYALSLSLNVLTTLMISIRLYIHEKELERVLGKGFGTPYTSITSILVESAATYGIWSFVAIILYAEGNLGSSILLGSLGQIQVIAPLLIILWIARGKAWNNKTQAALSTIQFVSAPVGGSVMVDELAGVREDVIELGGLVQDSGDSLHDK
ncbi:hypothetical protein HYDPIDRAFT_119682 [Hydnomerulius pinastri MD-312]|uniref:Uncharacterized protein n=1 Tax=Hydnomerulius pinastri MD-312 TaxID=994086 RepID=A0A0C9W6E6_9AGAM|nr:hypothetical protein HYDPIDRAFT_119682 [Hydnomerulius pinastri MD-312]